MSQHSNVIPLAKIFFLVAATRALTNCPHQCACEDNSIVCSCESTPFSKLVISSLGGTYVSSFTIHSCASVFVANDSFAGVVLSDRLEFYDIGRLTFEPHAFRNILQSPKQIVIDKCSLPVVLPYTFTGLSHMQHLWFRNSTIDKLSTHAFYHLTHVTYLYFRDVVFKRIQKKAFGKMYSIGHLFLGGSIRIERSDGFLFAASTVEEVLLEGVIGQLDESFLLDTSVQLATIRNSRIQMDSLGDDTTMPQTLVYSTQPPHTLLHIVNVTMNALAPRLLLQFEKITISNCSINRVQQSRRTSLIRHDTSLEFVQTAIGMIDSYAFANTTARSLTFTDCVVGKMKRLAAANSRFDRVEIANTRMESIDEGLFQNSHLKSLSVNASNIAEVLPMTFHRSFISDMEIVMSDIGSLDNHVFRGARIRTLTLHSTNVNNLRGKPFLSAEINTLHIVNCKLYGTPSREFFSRLTATHLLVINTTLDCDPDDCEVNSMFLRPPRHELLWTFERNSCRTPPGNTTLGKALCAQPTVIHRAGLTCRRSWAIADCVCTRSSASLPDINASVAVIGDCEHLTVGNISTPLHALYLFRIARCDVVKMPATTTTLKIFHSEVAFHEKAVLNNHISVMVLSHARVHRVVPKAFVNVTIDEMLVSNSSLTNWHPESVSGTKIAYANVADSRIGTVTSLLGAVRHLLIRNSILSSTKGLSAIRDVHLSNNTVLCCCEDGVTSCRKDRSMKQKCDEQFPYFVCLDSNYANDVAAVSFFVCYFFVLLTISVTVE